MEASEKKFNWDEEWNISFAGCGFRSVYHLGALSCILERVPRLVHGASKICGASSGCLVAAALTVGIPVEDFLAQVFTLAREARRHTLGVFHPTFGLLQRVEGSLLETLPEDAHLRASGRLCVSLTRLADGENILVSEFDSREELVQVLMCSCFFPVYCGFTPPSYRGVHYVDGALSNNMPLFEQRDTITVAPFSGESDICPREGTFNFFEVDYGNVSIQINVGNVHRICTSFLPPTLEVSVQKLAEVCHNGYVDALCFLREKDLLGTQCLPPSLEAGADTLQPAGREFVKTQLTGPNPTQEEEEGCWPDQRVAENLPENFKRILCEACRESHDAVSWLSQLTEFLPVKVVLFLLTFLLLLPMELTLLLAKSVIQSGCTVIVRLLTSATESCSGGDNNNNNNSASSEQRRSSSSGSDLRNKTGGDKKHSTFDLSNHPGSRQVSTGTTTGDPDLRSPTSACPVLPGLRASDLNVAG